MSKAMSLQQVHNLFGKFTYKERANGRIEPDGIWVTKNIVLLSFPFRLQGKTNNLSFLCHKLIAGALSHAIREAYDLELIKTFDGCYVPRHVLWDKTKALSRHSWGIAIDLNASEFPYGSSKKQNKKLTEIFKKYGFLNGEKNSGLWSTTLDPMHFEVVQIVNLPIILLDNIPIYVDDTIQTYGKIQVGKVISEISPIVKALKANIEWRPDSKIVRITSFEKIG